MGKMQISVNEWGISQKYCICFGINKFCLVILSHRVESMLKGEEVLPKSKTPKAPSGNGIELKIIFRALYHRNFRLFYGGQSISLIGTWMQRTTMGWLVYRLTDSAFLLGLVGFCRSNPHFYLYSLCRGFG